MRLHRLSSVVCLVGLWACYTPPEPPAATRLGVHESTGVVFQAVDAGTGGPLSDDSMTVRYLVRTPITYDATDIDRVPSIEPYEISHEVAEDNLVLEVRLEAPSYHRIDTVVTVRRGASAGPLTMRLSRRLDRVAQGPTTTTPTTRPDPPTPTVTPPSGADRSAMRNGDRAFQRGAWLEATEAYQRMPAPDDDMSEYGRDYLDAKVRQGVAHINRSEYGRALEILEEAADMEQPGVQTYLRLSEAQCAVGRTEEGRGTLAQLERGRNRMSVPQQNLVNAMIAYQRGLCSHGEFDRAQTTRERVRTGAQATGEFNAFIAGARQMSPVPPEVYNAVQDAERRIEQIRRQVGGRGRG